VVDPHFADAFADRLHVAGIAQLHPADARDDPRRRVPVVKFRKPRGKDGGLDDLHVYQDTQMKL